MKKSTRVFLILLRLAIGWHLLVEGVIKLDSIYTGPTTTNTPWSSRPYLLEATGPFGDWFRSIPGDPDESALDMMRVPAEPHLPAKLNTLWMEYFNGWCNHYGLTTDQRLKAQEIFTVQCQTTARWFREGTKDVIRAYPTGSVMVRRTTPERIADYERALQLYRELSRGSTLLSHAVWQERLRAAKTDMAAQRTDLLKDIEEKTNQLHRDLSKLLTPEQLAKGRYQPPPETNLMLWLADMATAWGLAVVGALLLLGLFTRLACVGGIGLLLLFYLAMPPLPWLPENPKSEGHYLLINKTLIEAIALGVLATLPTGRWAGLDGLMHLLFRRKPKDAAPPAVT
jgi:uncharacterized membrane protein YphA (DoxX/SURF4 family)